MALHQINDLDLPNFICGNPLVIVKFTAEDCPVCEALAPTFRQLSNKECYADVTFLKMDARENPIASKQVSMQGGTPFMATYRNGSLETCKVVTSEAEIIDLLDNLCK